VSSFDGNVLAGKVILVSGCGPGLGAATASAVVRGGGSVVLGDLNGAQVAGIAESLDPSGARVAHAEANIASLADCERLVALADTRFGRLDGLVHVAAFNMAVGGLMDGDLDLWDRVSEVNVKGTLQLTKAAVPLLRKSGGGSIVIVGSIAAIHRIEGLAQIAYGASKAALGSATHYLSRELGPDGIRVNVVAPGWKFGVVTQQAMAKKAASEGITLDELMQPILAEHPLRRLPDDEDCANTIVFLCSDLAPTITGQTIYIDGGLTA
jgi:NAD(P)-dependent dehydrogenase (short-subunit alcohol dehydrogenase family)